MKQHPRKEDSVVLPKPGTKRAKIVELMGTKGLTTPTVKLVKKYLLCETHCPAEALLLAEGYYERDDDWAHLGPIKDILIEVGFYKEMVTLVKPAPLVFRRHGKVYYYPHRICSFEWLDTPYK